MKIHFAKMHGLGNDFVILNGIDQALSFSQTQIKTLANRRFGIGFDQLLIVEREKSGNFYCRIFNADGSEAEQCGNGLRCVARYLDEQGLHADKSMTIATKAGTFSLLINDYDHIDVVMGTPKIQEKLIDCHLPDSNDTISLSILSFGNPHAIVKVDCIDTIMTERLGSIIAMLPFFPQGANVGFMQVLNSHQIRLRTYERGVGETFACGSNACAASVAGIINGWLTEEVKVDFLYGSLSIRWEGANKPLQMTGPAAHVYSGLMQI